MSVRIDIVSTMCTGLRYLDLKSLEEMIGTDCFETALEYVRRQAVLKQV
jgi:hypothetical protein